MIEEKVPGTARYDPEVVGAVARAGTFIVPLTFRQAAAPRTFRPAVLEGDPEWRLAHAASVERMPSEEVAGRLREKPGVCHAARRARRDPR